jgi:hypothetical protein
VLSALSQRVKRHEREANHSRLSSAEVKEIFVYSSTAPPRSVLLVKHKDNFTFYVTTITHPALFHR